MEFSLSWTDERQIGKIGCEIRKGEYIMVRPERAEELECLNEFDPNDDAPVDTGYVDDGLVDIGPDIWFSLDLELETLVLTLNGLTPGDEIWLFQNSNYTLEGQKFCGDVADVTGEFASIKVCERLEIESPRTPIGVLLYDGRHEIEIPLDVLWDMMGHHIPPGDTTRLQTVVMNPDFAPRGDGSRPFTVPGHDEPAREIDLEIDDTGTIDTGY